MNAADRIVWWWVWRWIRSSRSFNEENTDFQDMVDTATEEDTATGVDMVVALEVDTVIQIF